MAQFVFVQPEIAGSVVDAAQASAGVICQVLLDGMRRPGKISYTLTQEIKNRADALRVELGRDLESLATRLAAAALDVDEAIIETDDPR